MGIQEQLDPGPSSQDSGSVFWLHCFLSKLSSQIGDLQKGGDDP